MIEGTYTIGNGKNGVYNPSPITSSEYHHPHLKHIIVVYSPSN